MTGAGEWRPIWEPSGPPRPPWKPDYGFVHFLRFMFVFIALELASLVCFLGIVWYGFMLRATGRRARDLLLALIPIWNVIQLVQTLWRYSAKNVYWSTRSDLTSKPLFGP